jgi:hypothetical protein
MPAVFDPYQRRTGRDWRSSSVPLSPDTNDTFHVITDNVGGGCGMCRIPQTGVIWASCNYVLCLSCATRLLNAPDLHVYAPELFATVEVTDETFDDTSPSLITKRDSDFDPTKYSPYIHTANLSDRHGCAGYRCQTYSAPHRTIPANTQFMLGNNDRGHLCLACFQKLKVKWDALPERVRCPCCDRRVATERMVTVQSQADMQYDAVCPSCVVSHYMLAPETNGLHIYRGSAVWLQIPMPNGIPRRLYASREWAEAHWFLGGDRWFLNEEDAERQMFTADETYRTERLVRDGPSIIFGYGTNIIKMHGFPEVTKKNALCFGVELEMQPNRAHSQAHIVGVLGSKWAAGRPYILCADSSLGAAGVELITLPYTLADHKSDKYMPWKKLLSDLRTCAQSGINNTQCGMHVHMNRRALSNLQMGKMLVAINAPEMQELIVTIAQRSEAAYCHRYFKKVSEGGKIIGSHGDALNMSNSKGTVELRIFRGNLRYERVMKNLEFAEALCLYAAEQSIQKVHDPKEMVAWLEDNRGMYPHLVKFIREEYVPTKSFARTAARLRKTPTNWGQAAETLTVEPTEGDI